MKQHAPGLFPLFFSAFRECVMPNIQPDQALGTAGIAFIGGAHMLPRPQIHVGVLVRQVVEGAFRQFFVFKTLKRQVGCAVDVSKLFGGFQHHVRDIGGD